MNKDDGLEVASEGSLVLDGGTAVTTVKLSGESNEREFESKIGGTYNLVGDDGEEYLVTTTYVRFGHTSNPGLVVFEGDTSDGKRVRGQWRAKKQEGWLELASQAE